MDIFEKILKYQVQPGMYLFNDRQLYATCDNTAKWGKLQVDNKGVYFKVNSESLYVPVYSFKHILKLIFPNNDIENNYKAIYNSILIDSIPIGKIENSINKMKLLEVVQGMNEFRVMIRNDEK